MKIFTRMNIQNINVKEVTVFFRSSKMGFNFHEAFFHFYYVHRVVFYIGIFVHFSYSLLINIRQKKHRVCNNNKLYPNYSFILFSFWLHVLFQLLHGVLCCWCIFAASNCVTVQFSPCSSSFRTNLNLNILTDLASNVVINNNEPKSGKRCT